MRCPRDDSQLVEVDRQGIEIDYCPTCKGVWLDRRELDELINRSTAQVGYAAPPPRDTRDSEPPRDTRDSRDYRDEPSGRRSGGGGIMGRVSEMLDDDRDRSRRRHDDDDDRDDDDRYDDRDRSGRPRKRKKRSMLEDLFDF